MNKKHFPLLLILLVFGCGQQSQDVADDTEQTLPVRTLSIVDSIGVEMGDSNYVMGAVEGVAFGPDGNIAVLDCARACVRIYSPQGEYLRSIGRRGNGPGELQSIAFLAISQDSLVFVSGEGGSIVGLHVFDYATGEWVTSIQSQPPTCLEGADGRAHLRNDTDFDTSTGEPRVISKVTRWDDPDDDEASVVYHEFTFAYDPANMGHMISLMWEAYGIAADFDGRVYVAPYDTQQALVYAYEKDGTERFTLDLCYPPVERTEEEMEMERNVLRARGNIMDMDPIPLEPDAYKPLIRGLELDPDGNLWIHRGGCDVPTFDVYSPDGEPLFTAVVEGEPADGETWRVHVGSGGMLAYAEDPAQGFQKVYVLQLQ